MTHLHLNNSKHMYAKIIINKKNNQNLEILINAVSTQNESYIHYNLLINHFIYTCSHKP